MKAVTAYIADDGKTYNTEYEARQADARYKLGRLMDQGGVCRGGEWDADMMLSWMLDNADELAVTLRQITYAR